MGDMIVNLIPIVIILFFIINIISLRYYVIKSYSIESDKLEESLKLVLVTDLHMSEYGKGNYRIINDITRMNPDMILIAGDMLPHTLLHMMA